MANKSNKELIDEALALGQQLGVEVTTQGLGNAALGELVDKLKAQLPPGAEAPALVVSPEQIPPSPPLPPMNGASEPTIGGAPRAGALPMQRYKYSVAEGKAVTTRRGTMGAFQPISASDFSENAVEGQKVLERLVKSGHLACE